MEGDKSEDRGKCSMEFGEMNGRAMKKSWNIMESDQVLGYDGDRTGCRMMITEPSRHTSWLWRMFMTRNAMGFSD